ncbi:MAG: T9SS type A sorting domain-containing protein [Bacteroidetes bacterium]|nr:T9SS type A sorting domain-containing protein [Bacteroidota bacterium]
MKKILFILTLLASVFLISKSATAQTLRLDSIIGFPDTVSEQQVVNMSLLISNSGGFLFNGDLLVLMHSLGDSTGADTLYYNANYSISGNTFYDTVQITHTFNAAELDAGDNIVVVWPSSAQSPLAVNNDSLTFNLFFLNTGIEENERQQALFIYPNPSGGIIRFQWADPEKVEQVRIFDVLGKEILLEKKAIPEADIRSFSSGLYFIDVTNKDGSHLVSKFFRE